MPGTMTTLWTNQLVEASNFTFVAYQPQNILESAPVSNTTDNSIRVTVTYSDLQPANVLGSFYIGALAEYKDASNIWRPLPAVQFSPLRASFQSPTRILIMQPNMDTYNLGVDDSLQPSYAEVARISRVQGTLPLANFRVVISCTENAPGGPNAFQSVRISGEVERYNA